MALEMVQSKSWNFHHSHNTLWCCFCHINIHSLNDDTSSNFYALKCNKNIKKKKFFFILTSCTSKLIDCINESLVKFRSPFEPWFCISGQNKMHTLILHVLVLLDLHQYMKDIVSFSLHIRKHQWGYVGGIYAISHFIPTFFFPKKKFKKNIPSTLFSLT